MPQKIKETLARKNQIIKKLRIQLKRKKVQVERLKQKLNLLLKQDILAKDEHEICQKTADEIPGNLIFESFLFVSSDFSFFYKIEIRIFNS